MAEGLAGDQWNEGDVSCSVVRRVLLPDSFFAVDGLLETALVVISQMGAYPAVIGRENRHYLPFLATTTFLMEAVRGGAGRETAHEAIKEHAVAAVRDLRAGASEKNDLVDRLADDPRVGLDRSALEDILARAETLAGAAGAQVDAFVQRVDGWKAKCPGHAGVKPGAIL